MRKSFSPKPWALPQPVTIVGTYDPDGTPNAMNAAWTGQYDGPQVILCLSANHRTTKNILANKAFTMSFGTKEQVEACDYVGLVSGNTERDKVAKAGWRAAKAQTVNAPVFEQLPFTLECELAGQTENGNIIGNITAISCDEKYLDKEGKPDVKKMELITFNPVNNTYMVIDKEVAKAFHDGRKLMK